MASAPSSIKMDSRVGKFLLECALICNELLECSAGEGPVCCHAHGTLAKPCTQNLVLRPVPLHEIQLCWNG